MDTKMVILLALVHATPCAARNGVAGSELNDGAVGPLPDPSVGPSPPVWTARLRFDTVRSILEDAKGNYWFGSWNEGVCRFDGEKFTYFTVEDGLSNNQIRSIHEDRDGVVWFEGGFGVSGFDGSRIVTPTHRIHTTKDDWRLAAGDLWFKEDGGVGATALEAQPGAYRYDGTTFTYLAYPAPADPARVNAYATTGIAEGKGGRLWFATYAAVFGYDGKSFTVIDDETPGVAGGTGGLHVRCVFEDSKGRLWIGNNGIGVVLYDGNVATRFTQENGPTTPRPGDATDGAPSLHRVFSIGEDRAGNVWFGTVESGAWRYDGKSLRHFGAEDGLTSKDIMCIYKDRAGDLWLAGNGVFKFNGTSFDRVF